MEDLVENQQFSWNKKLHKIECDKNDIIEKKEKIFSDEVENLNLQFVEEKEEWKESVHELSKEKEQMLKENLKLKDQIISERQEERKESARLKDQMEENKLKVIQEFENKVKCFSEVKMEIDEQLRKQYVRLTDTLEDNMKLKVELEKAELKQSEMEQLLQQRDFVTAAAVSGLEQKLLKKEEEILVKNNKLHSATKKMESDQKHWNGLEQKLNYEIKQLKSSLNKCTVRVQEKEEILKRIRYIQNVWKKFP